MTGKSRVALLLVAAVGVLVSPLVGAGEITSLYTPLGLGACAVPPAEIARSYEGRDLAVEECPAPAPYRLFVVSSDARSWVDLRRNDLDWSSEQRVVYGRDVLALGHFPNVSTSGVAEWRLDEKGIPLALIVRLRLVDPGGDATQGATISRLLVVGLSADSFCDLGLAKSNEEARQLADMAATCTAAVGR